MIREATRPGPEDLTDPASHLKVGQLELSIDGDRFVMTRKDQNRASLMLDGMRPWPLERVSDGDAVVLATKLLEPDYPEEIRALRDELRSMVKQEQEVRLAFDNAAIESADATNRPEVLRIFDHYGWVTYSLAGKSADHDFWLLVQHQTPEIQRKLLPALEAAAHAGEASMSDYAYLYDRVQVGLGKPQRWGSQVKCENGKPILSPVEDPTQLDNRRKELYMRPTADYLQMDYLVKLCAQAAK